MVSFTLRTITEEERVDAKKVIRDLRKVFGKESIEVRDYKLWYSIEVKGANAWIGVKDMLYEDKSRLHLFNGDRSLNFDIDLDYCDTIYLL